MFAEKTKGYAFPKVSISLATFHGKILDLEHVTLRKVSPDHFGQTF